jgi:quercetin dioxygenase-like cupin family protein
MEPYLITLDSTSKTFDEFSHAGLEFIYMLQGRVDYRHAGSIFTLSPGDSLYFDALSPHGPAALLELPAVYLSIIAKPGDRGD